MLSGGVVGCRGGIFDIIDVLIDHILAITQALGLDIFSLFSSRVFLFCSKQW
jgi:hypothetical protein